MNCWANQWQTLIVFLFLFNNDLHPYFWLRQRQASTILYSFGIMPGTGYRLVLLGKCEKSMFLLIHWQTLYFDLMADIIIL